MELLLITEKLREFCVNSKEEFNHIDGLQGDGDLGVTVELMGNSIYEIALNAESLKEWLSLSGTTVRKQAPSTIGVLTAFALSAAARSMKEDQEMTSETFIELQRVMIEEIKKRGEADLGDRTILDAFIPAFQAYSNAIADGTHSMEALHKAVVAAEEGAIKTQEMVPKTGRASWVGERVVGTVDGGAWLCYKIYKVINDVLQAQK
ncbi:dihydroxyacetone kinase subunit L [Pullulanibacillus sp. KACC 23026]|uniref:dihydroxyacetone kinase subunit L n=1 Tax=Pullulanibacillus sp. KACC 23026 TaxID=3028315 RepID=UPI0023B059CA|nr:dihydroxyacetone kinase subunit L [Pullulanibacillus sp. KACC 23026]WEG11118.1 dihydroxyacetone kinase subunit L [Pullulanibacillus sp. KACC 23026]